MNDMKLRYYFVKALVSKAQAWERNGTGNYIRGFVTRTRLESGNVYAE